MIPRSSTHKNRNYGAESRSRASGDAARALPSQALPDEQSGSTGFTGSAYHPTLKSLPQQFLSRCLFRSLMYNCFLFPSCVTLTPHRAAHFCKIPPHP